MSNTNKIITYSDLVDYFQTICTYHVLLNPEEQNPSSHFMEYQEEFTGANMKSPTLILLPALYGIVDQQSDNHHLSTQVDFMIAISGKKGNPEANKTALDTAFGIAWDVVTKINADSKDYRVTNGRFISQFDPNSVRIEEFPPMGADYMIGYKVSFEFYNPKSIALNPSNWYY